MGGRGRDVVNGFCLFSVQRGFLPSCPVPSFRGGGVEVRGPKVPSVVRSTCLRTVRGVTTSGSSSDCRVNLAQVRRFSVSCRAVSRRSVRFGLLLGE